MRCTRRFNNLCCHQVMVQVIPTTRDMSSRVLRKVVSDFQMPQKDIKSDDTRNIKFPTDVSLT